MQDGLFKILQTNFTDKKKEQNKLKNKYEQISND